MNTNTIVPQMNADAHRYFKPESVASGLNQKDFHLCLSVLICGQKLSIFLFAFICGKQFTNACHAKDQS